MIYSTITHNIKVSVVSEYDTFNSFPANGKFVFKYSILIENLGNEAVMITNRNWLIYDVGFGFTEVKGDGVIGLTPELQPGERFKYFSNVILRSGMGNMQGSYTFINLLTREIFEPQIPKFDLMSEVVCN